MRSGTPGRRPGAPVPSTVPPGRALDPARGCYEATKRAIDVVGAAMGLILFSPVMAVVALIIKASDRGPVLHHREVIGRGGGHFKALKFRTMVVDADALLTGDERLRQAFERDVKLAQDPRVTRLGRLLRRTSLDELPQLFNVLRGEMSLVGPRMIHPSELPRYGDFAPLRHSVRPGITGLWQVSGRSGVPYEQRILLDQEYLRRRSLRLDLHILLKTVVVVLRRTNAV